MTTLLVSGAQFAADELWVEGERYRHLFRARRLATGERLRVVDGAGAARRARVETVQRHRALLRLGEAAASGEPKLRLELLVAPPRPQRAAWLVEKATEIGVAAIRFVASERAPRRYGAATLTRLRRVAAAAVEQSERSLLPPVDGVHDWRLLEELLTAGGERRRLEPGGGGLAVPRQGGCILVVGPEGGWTAAESAQLERLGCHAWGLGPGILRVETAAVAGAALCLLGGV